jgi:hypothetical protein
MREAQNDPLRFPPERAICLKSLPFPTKEKIVVQCTISIALQQKRAIHEPKPQPGADAQKARAESEES